MNKYVEKYVDHIIGNILGETVSDVGCYTCGNMRHLETIYCKKHCIESDDIFRLQLMRNNGKNVLKDVRYNLYCNNNGVLMELNNLKRTVNIDLYKKEMPKQKTKAKAKVSGKVKQSGGTKAKNTSKAKVKQTGGDSSASTQSQSGGGNTWLSFVKTFRGNHPELSYKECLKQAAVPYKEMMKNK